METKLPAATADGIIASLKAATVRGEAIAIATHQNPDFDAASSALVAQELVRVVTGQHADIYFEGVPTLGAEVMLSGSGLQKLVTRAKKEQIFLVLVDCHDLQTPHVIGISSPDGLPPIGLVIDHHLVLDNVRFGNAHVVIQREAPAAVVMLLEVLEHYYKSLKHSELKRFVAGLSELIALGIWTDAGFDVAEPLDMRRVDDPRAQRFAPLLSAAKASEFAQKVAQQQKEARERILRIVEERSDVAQQGGFTVVTCYCGTVQPAHVSAVSKAAEVLLVERQADAVMIAYLLEPAQFRGTIRTRNGGMASAAKLASVVFGGGGHKHRAGGTVSLRNILPAMGRQRVPAKFRQALTDLGAAVYAVIAIQFGIAVVETAE